MIRNSYKHLAAFCFLALFAQGAIAEVPCEYEVTIIQSPVDCGIGFVITTGLGLNEYGAVVGNYWCSAWEHTEAFIWTAEDGFITLDRPEGVYSASAVDINDNGVICGTAWVSGLGQRGFVYEDGEMTILHPVVPDGGWSSASAINNAGVVVGQRSITKDLNPQNAYFWSEEKGFTDLGVMNGGVSQATGITESGEVVGSSGGLASPGQEAFLWQDGKLTLLGFIPQGISSWAIAASSHGKIAGGGLMDPDKSDLPSQPAFWENGIWELLGVLPSCDIGGSRDVNDLGMVIGSCTEPNNTRHAFVWHSGDLYDLNDRISKELELSLKRSFAINNEGQILAHGNDGKGEIVAFLLTPQQKPLGDLNGDCVVEIEDLVELLENWGPCLPDQTCEADLNDDQIVSTADLLILLFLLN